MSKFDGALCSAPALLSVRLAQGCPSLDDELVAVGCASFSAGTSFSAIRAWMTSIEIVVIGGASFSAGTSFSAIRA